MTNCQMPMTSGNLQAVVEGSLRRLEGWLSEHGWEGWDPYDIKGESAFRAVRSVPLLGVFLKLSTLAFPGLSRRMFRVEKRAYPEAMAAFARGYLDLFKVERQEEHLARTRSCLNWLEENRCRGYRECCWGAAFDWEYERLLIPKGTPDSTATSMAARAFLDAYRELGERRYLMIAESACWFLIRGLNVDRLDENRVCFSYTPLDSSHVHNANLFSAALLADVGQQVGNKQFLDYARKAVSYSLEEQNPDGSWYYRSSTDFGGRHVDSYHTGFVLRNVWYLYEVLRDERIKERLLRGYRYYSRALFLGSVPKLTPGRLYPIDIYSCAEAILCLATLGGVLPEAADKACKVAEWTIRNMQDRTGHFYYRRYRPFTQKFAFIRWGQAIMFEALSCLLNTLREA